MKKILFTLAIALASYSTHAQTTNTFPSTGNVGIGTTSPAGKLVVNDNGDSNDFHMAGFYNTSISSGAVAGIEVMAGNAGVGGLLFF